MMMTLIVGKRRRGKSLELYKLLAKQSSDLGMDIITNLQINSYHHCKFCELMGYKINKVYYKNMDVEPEKIFLIKNTIVAIDETARYFPATSAAQRNKPFMRGVDVAGHNGQLIYFVCHFLEQVDKYLRDICDYIMYVDGFVIFDKKRKIFSLKITMGNTFYPEYMPGKSPLRDFFRKEFGYIHLLTISDLIAFKAYGSFQFSSFGSPKLVYGQPTYKPLFGDEAFASIFEAVPSPLYSSPKKTWGFIDRFILTNFPLFLFPQIPKITDHTLCQLANTGKFILLAFLLVLSSFPFFFAILLALLLTL